MSRRSDLTRSLRLFLAVAGEDAKLSDVAAAFHVVADVTRSVRHCSACATNLFSMLLAHVLRLLLISSAH